MKSFPSKPLVSIIIPVRNLSYFLLYENLPELVKQTYKKYEVIVLPNEHSPYDLTLLKMYKNLRIIPTGKITRPAQKRDIGATHAKGQILAFIDDDAYADPLWLENAVKLFQKNKISSVCGPGILPRNSSFWERVFNEVLTTWIGSGNYTYRFIQKKQRYVTDYPSMNFLIKKTVFQKLGGFNNDYWPGEDSKLCNDLTTKDNGYIVYDPQVLVYHHRRNNLKDYLMQHKRYGFHRGAFFAHRDRNSMSLGYVAPTLFLAYITILPILTLLLYTAHANRIWSYILIIPLLFYVALSLILLIKSFLNTLSLKISIAALITLFSTHVVYGTMFIKGFKKGRNNNQNIYE